VGTSATPHDATAADLATRHKERSTSFP
jgi:hypothetical protein